MIPIPDDWLPIGKIVAPQGLNGEVRVYPETQFPDRFLIPGERWILRPQSDTLESIELITGRLLGKGNVYGVRFAGVNDRNQAEALRGSQLYVPSSDRIPLEEGEFHYLDLVGLDVVEQTSQQSIGKIVDLVNAGNDLLVVALDSPEGKSKQVFIPFVEAIVPVVDLAAGRVEITPPPGLLDL
jgi:16S rRNA processing protein RimM